MILVLVLIFILYAILIISLAIGSLKVDEITVKNTDPKTTFSIVIPFRNEADNLPLLLTSIQKIKYPTTQVEFLFIDDQSSDNSLQIIEKWSSEIKTNIQVIKNKRHSNSPKKDAITTAISVAKNDWIITSDADCIFSENWLKSVDLFIQKTQPTMIVAPVNYQAKNTFLEQFQLLDFMSLQGTTIGGFGIGFPFLCNGANLGYKKKTFLKLKGFEGNDHIASGDDLFLFEKFIKANKKSVKYLKSKAAIATTFPVKSWTDLFNQRTRWAAKITSFSSIHIKLIGLLIMLVNFSFVYSICIASIELFLVVFILKMSIDLLLFWPTIKFFNQKGSFFKWYAPASLFYPFFSIIVLFKALFFKYNWKGRRYEK